MSKKKSVIRLLCVFETHLYLPMHSKKKDANALKSKF